jgi:hypothetical protein
MKEQKTEERKIFYEGTSSTAKEGRIRQGRGNSIPEGERTYLVGEVTHA